MVGALYKKGFLLLAKDSTSNGQNAAVQFPSLLATISPANKPPKYKAM